MKPLITALVDTYNQERYIEQALVSVLEQGLPPAELEIVVVDDGSTDDTPRVIQKFMPRVRHLRKKNGGQASAFNAGFAEVRGDFVAILDGDDWWAKGKLEAVLAAFVKHPEVAAVSHAHYQYYERTGEAKLCGPPQETLLSLESPQAARQALLHWVHLQTSALTVRRGLLERIMPIPEALVFSADAPIVMASMALGACVLPQPLSYYRFHGNNLYASAAQSGAADTAKLERRYDMDETMCRLLWPLLLGLGVREECVAALLVPFWCTVQENNRELLRAGGGSRLRTLRTELRSFRLACDNPSFRYRLFKYLAMAPAALLFSPPQFYRMREWYARKDLGRLRNVICKTVKT